MRLLGFFNKEQKVLYRRLFIFEPVKVAQKTGGLLNNSSLSAAKEFLYLSPSRSLSHSKMSVWSFSSDEEGGGFSVR